ncbi:RICIN domain-containing protein [Cohnella silvisoli]|uniref:RICIN domain-containing protein n=1 Tax=Cohnella silvisoli TaxID=2873699 RepID=A0ABV1L0T8_9BACL|nr:RICIN domain-containing protein [Cohnella silvisoli]MCD9024901.1 RICIN domain-containing protein [Cohnella silvisoli]
MIKKWSKLVLCFAMAILTIVSSNFFVGGNTAWAANTTYYVSASGNDNNNGTSTNTPWQTISKVNSMSFSPGDKILFQGGQLFEGQLKIITSGTSGSPITVGSYGTGKATITNTAGQQDNKYEYFGSWNYNAGAGNAYGGDDHWSHSTNDFFTLKFYGTQFKMYSDKGWWGGIGAVSVDGGPETNIDFYSSPNTTSQVLYTSPVLRMGEHIIKVRVTGTKNANSTDITVPADRIDVTNGGSSWTTINDDKAQIHANNIVTYWGSGWKHNITEFSSSGTQYSYDGNYYYSENTNDYAELPFYGDRVKAYVKTMPWFGKVAYSIDGGAETIVDLYTSSGTSVDLSTPKFDSGPLTNGQHTLKIRVTGQRNSSNTDSHAYDAVDAFDVTNNGVTTRINDNGFDTSNGIYIDGVSYITIDGVNVLANGRYTNSWGSGVRINNGDHIVVNNVDASGFQLAGIVFFHSSNLTLTNINAHDNGNAGIRSLDYQRDWVGGNSNIYIGNSSTNNNPGDPTNPNDPNGDGICLYFVKNGIVEYTEASNNGWDMTANGVGGPTGIWGQSLDNVVFQYNNSNNNAAIQHGSYTDDGGGYDIDGINSTLQYSYSSHNGGPSLLSWRWNTWPYSGAFNDNNVARYNVMELDGWGSEPVAFRIGDGYPAYPNDPVTWKIYNNTVYIPNGNATEFLVWNGLNGNTIYSGVKIWNNIFYTSSNFSSTSTFTSQWQGNNYFSDDLGFHMDGYNSLAAWRSGTGKEKNGSSDTGLYANPALSSPGGGGTLSGGLSTLTAYKLLNDSPAINAGLNLNSLFGVSTGGKDFWGTATPVGSAYDIGAYEGGGVAESKFAGGDFKIINTNSGKALDTGGSTSDGANAVQNTYTASTSQKWTITYVGNGYYKIINKNSGKALDITGASQSDGTNAIQWTYSGSVNQLWSIVQVGNGNGNYRLTSKNSGKALDMPAASTADGVATVQWTYSGGVNQMWQISAP